VPYFNSLLHTTCVATMLTGGHAPNALPQMARANVNCRIFPGEEPEAVRKTLEKLLADPKVTVTIVPVKAADGTLLPQVSVPPSPLLQEVGPGRGKTVHSLCPVCLSFRPCPGSFGRALPPHRGRSNVWNCLPVLRIG